MKQFKGTPGPWERDYDNSDVGAGQWQIAGPAEIHYGYRCTTQQEECAIADANLIAAAPQLLEALSGLIYGYERRSGDGLFDMVVSGEDIERAVKAINKALGE